MSKNNGKWVYNYGSCDDPWYCEGGYFDTREEAIRAARAGLAKHIEDYRLGPENIPQICVGQIYEHQPEIDTDRLIEDLQEAAWDEYGEWAEGWLDMPLKHLDPIAYMKCCQQVEDLGNRLSAVLREWLHKTNNEPNFYTIINAGLVSPKEEDDNE